MKRINRKLQCRISGRREIYMALKDFLFGDKKPDSGNSGGNAFNKGTAFEKTAVQSGQTRQPAYQSPRYYVLRECVTGMTEYGYFRDDKLIGAAAVATLPSFPVRLQCEELNLSSEFDKTVFPGVTREIINEIDGSEYAQITGFGDGTHMLRTPEGTFVVKTGPGLWHFLRDGFQLASLTREGGPGSQLRMTVREAIPDSLALLFMSFPLMQMWR